MRWSKPSTDAARLYKPGERIILSRERTGQPGDLFILLGAGETDVIWDTPLAVTETSYQYIKQAPSKESPAAERLKYFVRFLEYPDQMVSDDAYSEFASAPYKDIVPIGDSLPREDLRRWVSNPETSKLRLGLYGLMLGLCGNADDAQLLREIIEQPAAELRLGIDGIMGGYVLLTGADGLEVIDAKLRIRISSSAKPTRQCRSCGSCGPMLPSGCLPSGSAHRMRTLLQAAPTWRTWRSPTSPAGRTGRSSTGSSRCTASRRSPRRTLRKASSGSASWPHACSRRRPADPLRRPPSRRRNSSRTWPRLTRKRSRTPSGCSS